MSGWHGPYLIIDKENYGKYLCLHMSKLMVDELLEFYKVEKLVAMINEAIRNLPPEELKKAQREEARMRNACRFVEKPSLFQIQNVSQLIMEYNNHNISK